MYNGGQVKAGSALFKVQTPGGKNMLYKGLEKHNTYHLPLARPKEHTTYKQHRNKALALAGLLNPATFSTAAGVVRSLLSGVSKLGSNFLSKITTGVSGAL